MQVIVDEFSTIPDRRRRYQLRRKKEGRCIACGKPLFNRSFCKDHAVRPAHHGLSYSKIYQVWNSMKQRCYDPKDVQFKDYGGRGITVCERWLNSVTDFFADMGEPPSGKSIDRINNNGNYEPNNCRWATHKEQQRNRRNNVVVTVSGKTGCLVELAEHFNIPINTVIQRKRILGWSWEDSFLRPIKKYNARQTK